MKEKRLSGVSVAVRWAAMVAVLGWAVVVAGCARSEGTVSDNITTTAARV